MKIVKVKTQPDDKRYSTIHVFISGETLGENLMNRHQRPYTTFRKEVLPLVFKELGWPANTKVGWNQRYYCGCGCSPCFVVKDHRCQTSTFVGVTVKA